MADVFVCGAIQAMAVITLSATVHELKPPTCSPMAQQAGTCVAPSALQRAVLYLGMGLLVVSAGGMNPTSLPFGADQFDERKEQHKGGLARFYNWYYAAAMIATFLALTVVLYVQVNVSWGLGFAIPTALMAVAFVVFLVGTKVYVYVPPEGSIFSSVARVFVASCLKWRLPLPHPENARRQEELLYNPPAAVGNGRRVFKLPLTLQLSFLNKVAIVTDAADEIRRPGEAVEPVQRAAGGGGQVPPEDHPRVDLQHPVVHRGNGADKLHVPLGVSHGPPHGEALHHPAGVDRRRALPLRRAIRARLRPAHRSRHAAGHQGRTRHHLAPEAGRRAGGRRAGVRGRGRRGAEAEALRTGTWQWHVPAVRVPPVRFDLPPVRPNGLFGPCSRALIGGAQPYMVGGPSSHGAIKERWGPGLAVRGSPRRQSPHRHPNPNPILRRGAASDGKHHRRRQRHPDALAAAEDATAPTPPSPPNVAAGAQMASANETPAGASTTTAFDGLLPLIPLLSVSL